MQGAEVSLVDLKRYCLEGLSNYSKGNYLVDTFGYLFKYFVDILTEVVLNKFLLVSRYTHLST